MSDATISGLELTKERREHCLQVAREVVDRGGRPWFETTVDICQIALEQATSIDALLEAAEAAADEFDTLMDCRRRRFDIEEAVNESSERVLEMLRAAIHLAKGNQP